MYKEEQCHTAFDKDEDRHASHGHRHAILQLRRRGANVQQRAAGDAGGNAGGGAAPVSADVWWCAKIPHCAVLRRLQAAAALEALEMSVQARSQFAMVKARRGLTSFRGGDHADAP